MKKDLQIAGPRVALPMHGDALRLWRAARKAPRALIRARKFPVPSFREFGGHVADDLGVFQSDAVLLKAGIDKFPVFFPVSRELG
jgi:hypothetical protein